MRGALLAALLATPALAQDDACRAEWATLTGLVEAEPEVAEEVGAEDGWCVARGLTLGDRADRTVVQVVEALRWRIEGLDRLAAGTGLPHAAEVEVEGYRTLPSTGSPVLDWALAIQGEGGGIDARLSARWDEAARELRVGELSADLPGDNSVIVKGTVANLDLTSLGALQTSAGSAALLDAEAGATLDGAFEAFLLLPLATALLDDGPGADPGAEAAALVAQARAVVAEVPDPLLDDASRAALAAALGEVPRPRGVLSIGVDAGEAGLGAARFARFALTGWPERVEDLWPVLEGVEVRVGWSDRDK